MSSASSPANPTWFELIHFPDRIMLISEKRIKPELRGNIWWIQGRERDILLDAGWGLVSLAEAGLGLRPERTLAVASHTHFDHIGSLHEFENRAVHPLEASILEHPDPLATQSLPFLIGYPPFVGPPPPVWQGAEHYQIVPAPAKLLLEDGDLLDLGDRQFEVLHTPGHSPGSISLWEAATGALFPADLLFEGPLFDDIPGADRNQMLASHQRIARLPVERVYPGHFNPFNRQRMHELIDAYRRTNAKGPTMRS